MPAGSAANPFIGQGDPLADTRSGGSSATAPAANAVLASIASPGAGTYEVEVVINLDGSAEAAKRNLTLRQNGNVVATLPTVSGQSVRVRLPRVTVTGGNLDVIAAAAGAVGAVYTVSLFATRVA